MDDDIGFLEFALRLEREQLRVAGTRTHERDAADRRGGVVDQCSLKLAGIGERIAGKEGLADRAEEIALPEGAAVPAMWHALGHGMAQVAGGLSERTQGLRQHRLDPAAQAHAEYRRRSFRADRH